MSEFPEKPLFVGIGLQRRNGCIMFVAIGGDRSKVESETAQRIQSELPPGMTCDGSTVLEIGEHRQWERQLRHWLFESFDVLGADANQAVRSFQAGMLRSILDARAAKKLRENS